MVSAILANSADSTVPTPTPDAFIDSDVNRVPLEIMAIQSGDGRAGFMTFHIIKEALKYATRCSSNISELARNRASLFKGRINNGGNPARSSGE